MSSPQALSVKRAQVEFHNFASLGEPERALRIYAEENRRRSGILQNHLTFLGPMTPFLEIGANVGHTSYMLVNDFAAQGFALDISADALRHGIALRDRWGYEKSPVRVAGDAANLPFADGSLRMVCAFQMLSQFMDIERIFVEVKRVLAPGGVFFFSEEPLRRKLSLRLYRCPYYETMKPWERRLYDHGLLGYVVRDVIGAHQEESFGIRQNHTMGLRDWHHLIEKHFAAHEYEIFVPERGWGERIVKRAAVWLDPYGSEWRAGILLGGTLSAMCRKAGEEGPLPESVERFESFLRCPDCHGELRRDAADGLCCASCGYSAADEGGVYNLLPSAERKELYPGARPDVIDFSQPEHAAQLGEGWYELEGVYGNKYRWMGQRARARLTRVSTGPQRLRVRAHVQESMFASSERPVVELYANGVRVAHQELDRSGLLVVEAPVADAPEYTVDLAASPVWQAAGDARLLTLNVSMIRLVPAE